MARINKARILIVCILSVLLVSFTGTYIGYTKNKIKSKKVNINATDVVLEVGNIATLSAIVKPANSTDKLTWSSSNEEVAKVNRYGVVTALTEGEAVISVTTSSKKKATCNIKVKSSLSKEQVEDLIKSGLLSEETVSKIIAESTITEADVKKVIAENTLSEEQIKELINNNKTSSDASANSAVSETGEVPLINTQHTPLAISNPNNYDIVGNVTDIKVSKQPMTTQIFKNNTSIFLPYKYDIVMTINVGNVSDNLRNSCYAHVTLGSTNVTDCINAAEDTPIVRYTGSTPTSSNTLTEMVTIYSAYNIDKYFVKSITWERT
ncbi:MAG: Ig-like domain-containing protein [Lachnospiraceae bacterium]|nr:Ig-like domain-containing protein [Lachnospiraceae bacterium]